MYINSNKAVYVHHIIVKKFYSTNKVPEKQEKQEAQKNVILNIPNALSFSRLLLSPVIGYLILQDEIRSAIYLLGVASVTDALDGYIAKNYKQQSVLGTFLDPLADKVLMSVCVITLGFTHLLPMPAVGLILFRDFCLVLGAAYYRYKSLPTPFTWNRFFSVSEVQSMEIKPTVFSKLNTILQLALVGTVMVFKGFNIGNQTIVDTLTYTVMFTTFFSGVEYFFSAKALKFYKTHK